MLSVVILLYFIYQILITGLNSLWNWFLALLTSIGIWVEENVQIVIISLIVVTLVPFIFRTLYMKELNQSHSDEEYENNGHSVFTEEEKQNASFERWYKIQQDPILDRTEKIIDIMNEMLKSNRHKKEYEDTYRKLLHMNGFGYVYFVKAPDGTTKIGLTHQDPFKRIIQIFGGVNTSYNIKVIHLVRTDQPEKVEKEFHEYFSEKRHINPYNPAEKSEFFHLDEDDWKWIKRQLNVKNIYEA